MAHARRSWELVDTISYAIRWWECWDQDPAPGGVIEGVLRETLWQEGLLSTGDRAGEDCSFKTKDLLGADKRPDFQPENFVIQQSFDGVIYA